MRRFMILVVTLTLLLVFAAIALGQDTDSAHIRFAHFSVDAGEVDIYVDGDVVASNVAFPDVSNWMEVSAGTVSVAVTAAGGSLDDAVLGPMDVEIAGGDWLTVAVIGDVAHDTLAVQVLVEDYGELLGGETRLSVFHAIGDAPPLNVMANDTELVTLLGYPGYFGPESDGFAVRDIIAQPYEISLTTEDGSEFLNVGEVLMGEGRNYFVAAVGLAADPQFVLVVTDPNDMMMGEPGDVEEIVLGDGTAQARVAHLAPGLGDVDIYLGGELVESEFVFPSVGEWMELDADFYQVAVTAAGDPMEDAVLEVDVPLVTDTHATIAVIGSIEKDNLTVQLLDEDFSEIPAGETRLSVFNSISDAPPVNVVVNGEPLIVTLGYPGYLGPDSDGLASVDIVAGTHAIQITLEDGTEVLDLGELVMGAGRHYWVAATGLASNPLYVVVVTEPE
jgi:hypothetical protein